MFIFSRLLVVNEAFSRSKELVFSFLRLENGFLFCKRRVAGSWADRVEHQVFVQFRILQRIFFRRSASECTINFIMEFFIWILREICRPSFRCYFVLNLSFYLFFSWISRHIAKSCVATNHHIWTLVITWIPIEIFFILCLRLIRLFYDTCY